MALIVLGIGVLNPTIQWAFDPTPGRLRAAAQRHKAEQEKKEDELSKRKRELSEAHSDARELLADQLNELGKKFESDRSVAASERAQLRRDVDAAAASRSAEWSQLFTSLTWVHFTLFGGLISLGIGQMIAAFRDMAINSFRGS